jgi:mitochondrial fission process protein 1
MGLLKIKRYLAYSSDIGESVRPVVNPKIVTLSYGVAWAYILGDCGYISYLERLRGES